MFNFATFAAFEDLTPSKAFKIYDERMRVRYDIVAEELGRIQRDPFYPFDETRIEAITHECNLVWAAYKVLSEDRERRFRIGIYR